MKKIKLLSCLYSAFLTMSIALNGVCFSNAVSIGGIVDNDTSNPNYSNNSHTYTHYSGTWGIYLNSGLNGDSRLRQSTTPASYEWVWGGGISSQSSISWIIKIYLANNSFTDTGASYEVFEDSLQYIPFCTFNINQNLAPSGYSQFSGVESGPSMSGGYYLNPWYGLVTNSGLSGVGTGSDACYFLFTY